MESSMKLFCFCGHSPLVIKTREWKSHFCHRKFTGCIYFFSGFSLFLSLLLAIGYDNLEQWDETPLHQQMPFAIFTKTYACYYQLIVCHYCLLVYCLIMVLSLHLRIQLIAHLWWYLQFRSVTNSPVLHVNAWPMLCFAL